MRLSRGILVPVAVVALSLVSAEGVAAKCYPQGAWPGFEPGAPVMMQDGSIIGAGMGEDYEAYKEVAGIDDPTDVHSVEFYCWNPATGAFQPGIGVDIIAVWTTRFVESMRAPIEVLLRAQEAYFSQHSRYAQSLDDLVGLGVPEDSMLEFSATLTGWSATTPRDDVDYRCFVYSGDAPQELAKTKEHEIVCQPEKAKVSRALQEMYESLVGD